MWLDGDDDLAELRVRLQVAVGGSDFAEGEGLVDDGFEVAGGDVVVDVLSRLGELFGIRG